ncbi:sensor histidine kinase [Nocardioides euryhalodurans]|uniref:histidine kinase n=1 Tax=Nocardioides euryhalodurans TaxID=2518370 RepID=A0A4P7GPZ2_9ACTN|nr:histidine kinase [Nocardioides euryhalodurans]QBR93887.1 sensor histidine kinase [Nocardioides euryhalodurans]
MEDPRGVRRLERADWLWPAVICVAAIGEVLIVEVPPVAGTAVSVLACVLLVGRRLLPMVFATGAVLVLMFQHLVGVDESQLAVQMAVLFAGCFSLGRYVPGLLGLWGIGVINATLYLPARDWPTPTDLVWGLSLTAGPWIVGRIVQAHARLNALLAEQAEQLVAEQALLADRAVVEERRRIARELHDIVAHSLSVMVVQAGAAQDVVRRDPEAAERALTAIQEAGRAALGDTGRLLHLLRDDDGDELDPPPATRNLPALVEGFRDSGLDVELVVDGPTEGLSAGVDLSVYRIVQESLTNALKHGAGDAVRVSLRRGADGVDVEVLSASGKAARVLVSHGQGLIGMRERVAVFGGELKAGPTTDGGYLVRAHLPVPVS